MGLCSPQKKPAQIVKQSGGLVSGVGADGPVVSSFFGPRRCTGGSAGQIPGYVPIDCNEASRHVLASRRSDLCGHVNIWGG